MVLVDSRDILVGIETRLWAGKPRNRASIYSKVNRLFSSPYCPNWFWAHQSSSTMNSWGCFLGGKAVEAEIDQSPPSNTKLYLYAPHVFKA